MRIEVSFNAAQLDELQLRDKNVVVIDVLRASTTVAVALANGAREIIPVATIESAVKISGSLFGEVTLRGGERNGRMIEGFNLGNSPAEYTDATVRGKSIIFCTTNGSVAMAKSRYARRLFVGSFVNLSAIVDAMLEDGEDYVLLCAGKPSGLRSFSIEDAVCAGMMIQKLIQAKKFPLDLPDASRAAATLYKGLGRSLLKLLKLSDHGQYLAEIGFAADLKLCAAVDSVPVVPVQQGTVIKLRKPEERPVAEPDPVRTEPA
ncbi:MAG: 2-phosphosulfolactate phosphatase [Bacteroidetes bacterium]|nr:2-phosphosulfolactate phosphatase [Bacteroidota bacterium]